jgi:hypothetical protein
MYFVESQCINFVYFDLVRPFRSALVDLELFFSSFFPSLSIGGVVGALYPFPIDLKTSNPSACMCVFIVLL